MKFSIKDFFSRVSCGFGYIYWRRRNGKLYFLCGDIGYVYIISHVYRVFRIFQSTLIYASTIKIKIKILKLKFLFSNNFNIPIKIIRKTLL